MSDIQELMRRDPLELTDDNIMAIISEFRARRHLFNSKPATAAKKVPASQKRMSLGVELDL